MLHLRPFQRSTSVAPLEKPTAVHAFVDVHDTAEKEPPLVRLGVGWITQAAPFHLAANGCAVTPTATPAPTNEPTAMQAFGAVHDTPYKLPGAPGTG
jgi:hypothetical protein